MGTTARDDALRAAAHARNAQGAASTFYEREMAQAVESLADAVAKIGFTVFNLDRS
ncbi:hypothetical protein [Mycolicibacterium conceptionense]|uniref:hypothetical protein n=1 Tax=Mycolicibacterium conceptionense TaxID=451644 RepID=UPI0013F5D52E|nr:hypothetical protein [Mycolicibacterium conceptionense]